MDAVYAAGSLPIAAEDHVTKAMATRLTIFGFVVLDEVQADGTTRRLRPSEAVLASTVILGGCRNARAATASATTFRRRISISSPHSLEDDLVEL